MEHSVHRSRTERIASDMKFVFLMAIFGDGAVWQTLMVSKKILDCSTKISFFKISKISLEKIKVEDTSR